MNRGVTPPGGGGGTGGVTLAEVVDALYPVGAIYVSTLATNPGVLFGGTWAAFGAGRVLVGLDGADVDFDTVEETGGAKTVASAGSVAAPVFTGAALGTHAHGVGTYVPSGHAGTAVSAHAGTAVADHAAHTHSVTSNVTVGNHAALATHQHELPFQLPTTTSIRQTAVGTFGTGTSRAATATITTTANTTSAAVALSQAVSGGTPDAHAVTNNAVTSGNPSATLTHSVTQPGDHTVTQPSAHTMSGSSEAVTAGTPAGTNSAPTYTGSPTSVLQPFVVVYMFKRTA